MKKNIGKETQNKLITAAEEAQKRAYSPYSGFSVGAALLCADGTVYSGCNIENASFSPTICAERVAFFKAVSDGKREFDAIAVVGSKDLKNSEICPPCGVCRQVMSEFCDGDFVIILSSSSSSSKEVRSFTLKEILPLAFGLE